MDKASVTSPIDFLKNLRLFMGGMGGAIYWKILRNTKYKCSERI